MLKSKIAKSLTLNFAFALLIFSFYHCMFINFLTYKVKKIIKVDKWFPSSKTCSVYSVKNPNLTLKDRTFICACGNIIDRDYNAAINIKQAGLVML